MKIFLAGTNGVPNKSIVFQSDYVLESYYYIKPWQYRLIDSCKMFLLDSGAFTFFSAGKHIDWDQYLEQYIRFINEHDVKYFFELDIDDLIGYERVLKIREKLEGETGKKSIPVWHISRGRENFERMCEEYDYVAIGGLVGKERKSKRQQLLESSFPWFINTAHKNGAKIHALGYTKVKDLVKYHFDSVDSTRWNCQRYGRVEYFDGETIRAVDKRKNKMKIRGGEYYEKVNDLCFAEWIKFQKYADRHL